MLFSCAQKHMLCIKRTWISIQSICVQCFSFQHALYQNINCNCNCKCTMVSIAFTCRKPIPPYWRWCKIQPFLWQTPFREMIFNEPWHNFYLGVCNKNIRFCFRLHTRYATNSTGKTTGWETYFFLSKAVIMSFPSHAVSVFSCLWRFFST